MLTSVSQYHKCFGNAFHDEMSSLTRLEVHVTNQALRRRSTARVSKRGSNPHDSGQI